MNVKRNQNEKKKQCVTCSPPSRRMNSAKYLRKSIVHDSHREITSFCPNTRNFLNNADWSRSERTFITGETHEITPKSAVLTEPRLKHFSE